jgi:hypothetical protein
VFLPMKPEGIGQTMAKITSITSTLNNTMVDFGDGLIDVSRLYPDVHAAPPENRAQMLREMLRGQKTVPNTSPSVSGQKGLKKKTYINQ